MAKKIKRMESQVLHFRLPLDAPNGPNSSRVEVVRTLRMTPRLFYLLFY